MQDADISGQTVLKSIIDARWVLCSRLGDSDSADLPLVATEGELCTEGMLQSLIPGSINTAYWDQ